MVPKPCSLAEDLSEELEETKNELSQLKLKQEMEMIDHEAGVQYLEDTLIVSIEALRDLVESTPEADVKKVMINALDILRRKFGDEIMSDYPTNLVLPPNASSLLSYIKH